ncbi:MAG TPA: RimK family alpha-L-glutamate ligase [Polyangiaceae bacterium]|nr:RimK family alpha-L-glutamate ligase [Polyangiaceae bacterium]
MSLRVAILSCNAQAYSTRRLREACERRGHHVKVLHTLRFSLLVESGKPALFFRNRKLTRYDAVIPRIGASISSFGTAVVRQFEQMGVFSLNSSSAISAARDKLRSIQLLSRHEVGIPPTAFARDRNGFQQAIESVGGAPVVIKLLEGAQGIGVLLAETAKQAESIIETLHSTRKDVVIQRFVSESRGRDIRAFVVGDRVVAAISRQAAGDEFRANLHRGGRASKIEIDPAFERTAIVAAQVMGLHVAGVDMVEGPDGPQVLEVNSSPGLEGIEAATGIDVASAIVEQLEQRVAFPDFDLRQRLTLKSGYGVVEFRVPSGSEFAERALSELSFSEREVRVLSITRDSSVLPNPRGTEVLRAGDVLLCFGSYATLAALLPRHSPAL